MYAETGTCRLRSSWAALNEVILQKMAWGAMNKVVAEPAMADTELSSIDEQIAEGTV